MKVVHIINSLSPGGAERLVVNLMKQSKLLGFKQEIFILNKRGDFFLKDLQDTGLPYAFSKRKSLYNPLHILDIREYLINNDIVNVHLFPALYWVALSKLIFGSKAKLVFTEHSTANNRRKYKALQIIDAFIYKFYEKIITISADTKESLNQWVRGTKQKCTVINNGIEVYRFSNANTINLRNKLNINKTVKLLLCVGSLRPAKNHRLLIHALAKLNRDIQLVIIGTGSLLTELKELSFSLQIADKVHYLGIKNNVEQYYKACDLFVLPSKWEGFGLVAAEAMASGIPVLVSNVPGLSQVVDNAGFQFESENINDLVDKINFIFENPEIVEQKIKKAKERVKQFSIEAMANKYYSEYKRILSKC